MTRRLLLPLLLLLTLLSGCRKNEFLLEFRLPTSVSESYTLLYYASDSRTGWLYDQVAVISAGNGSVKGVTRNPTLVYVFQGSNVPGLVIYAERGDKISIQGENAAPAGWRIKGNKINEALTGWRMDNIVCLSQRDGAGINSAVTRFVKANPEDPVSSLLMLVYYDRSLDPKGFDSTYKLLRGKAVDPKWTDLVNRNDMVGGYAPASHKTGSLIFRTAGNGCDTIRFDSVPALLYFASNNYGTRKTDLKEIKRLLKERTDSARALVIDVNMEPDSSAWRYQTRADTLNGAVRAWMPLSFSDTAARALGIKVIPTYVVVGRGGAILYRGGSAPDAVRQMQQLLKNN